MEGGEEEEIEEEKKERGIKKMIIKRRKRMKIITKSGWRWGFKEEEKKKGDYEVEWDEESEKVSV